MKLKSLSIVTVLAVAALLALLFGLLSASHSAASDLAPMVRPESAVTTPTLRQAVVVSLSNHQDKRRSSPSPAAPTPTTARAKRATPTRPGRPGRRPRRAPCAGRSLRQAVVVSLSNHQGKLSKPTTWRPARGPS
jgi:hypothetical protein